jgi:hypothetical protein
MQTKDAQSDFLALLHANYVVSAAYITRLFAIRNPAKFVQGVRDRTELDIYEGKIFSYEANADEIVYFMISDIKPECPGLGNMAEPVLPIESVIGKPEIVEYQDGYYVMWDCPACSQFHKVDLGDEELVGPIFVRCIKCGITYQVTHKEE